MSTPSIRVREHIEIFTPLGIRFWDHSFDRAITDGLRVTARPWHSSSRTSAVRSRSDVYTFRWLPGMRPVEHRQDDPDFFDASVPRRRPFVVTVEDDRGRFLPAAFRVDLPLPYRGVFLAESDASIPDGARRGVHLFSAPTRPTDDRLTAVRGTLVDAVTREPVPWSRVIVQAPHGRVFHGVADGRGRFAVMFPYPSLAEGFGGSPGSFGNGVPIGERGWDIALRVHAQPGVLTTLPGTALPEYRSIFSQIAAELWDAAPDPSASSAAALSLHLPFGEQLIVRTHSLSELLVTPAPGSP
jgi:hypothetical protein